MFGNIAKIIMVVSVLAIVSIYGCRLPTPQTNNPVDEISQLRGQSVGVVIGSEGEAALLQLAQGSGLASTGYADFNAALDGLLNGEVVALLTERQPALAIHFRQENQTLNSIGKTCCRSSVPTIAC